MIARIATPFIKPSSPEELRRYDLLLAGFDLLDQAIAVFDATPKLVTWNKAMLRLLDFPESLVRVGTPFEAFVRFNLRRGEYAGSTGTPPSEAEIERLVAERMAAVRAFQPHQAERTRPNGQVLSIRGVPIPNLGFVSLWTDITEQRRYERLIESQNAELETRVRARTGELEAATGRLDKLAVQLARSEERLRLILDAIPAMIAYVDAGERYQFANRGYAEWFGLDKDSIVGRSIEEVFGPEAYAHVRPYLEQAAQGERVRKSNSQEQTDYVYNEDGQLIGEYGKDGQAKLEYLWLGNVPVGVVKFDTQNQPTLYYVESDQLNTPRQVTSQSKKLMWQWQSEPFGSTAADRNVA